jgi:hypothetical protein
MKNSIRRCLVATGITATPAAVLANGGDTFATATVLPNGALNFSDTGNTTGFVNDINGLAPGVSQYTQVAGPDVFYKLNIGTGGSISITLTPQSPYDAAIYLTQTNLVTGNPALGAGSGKDATGAGGVETLTLANIAAGTYYLAIDSFYAAGSLSQGTFNLLVTGTAIINAVAVPEPASAAALLGATVVGGATWRRRRTGAVKVA